MATDYIGQYIQAITDDNGALLAADQQSPQAGGSLTKALDMYQNGPGNDLPQAGDTTASGLLNIGDADGAIAHANANVPGANSGNSWLDNLSNSLMSQVPPTGESAALGANPSLGQSPSWLPPDIFPRTAIAIFAFVFIVIAIAALALKSDPISVVKKLAK